MGRGKVVKNYIYNTLYQILVMLTPLITTPYVSIVLCFGDIGDLQSFPTRASSDLLVGNVGTNLYGQREIAYFQNSPRERSIVFWEIEIFRLITVGICTVVYFFIFCLRGQYSLVYFVLSFEVISTAFDISWLYMGMENFKLTVIRNTIIRLTGVVCIFIFVKSSDDGFQLKAIWSEQD